MAGVALEVTTRALISVPSLRATPEAPAQPGQGGLAARAQRARVGWGHFQHGLDEVRSAFQHGLVLGIGARVLLAELGDFLLHRLLVRPQEEVTPIGEGGEGGRGAWEYFEAELLQTQLLDNLWAKQGGHVGAGGHLETGEDLLGYGSATHHVAPLQDHNLQAGLRQIRGRHQAVVAATDDDSIIDVGHSVPPPGDITLWNRVQRSHCSARFTKRQQRGGMNGLSFP